MAVDMQTNAKPENEELKLMKVAHVYMSFQSITFQGYEIKAVRQNAPIMENKAMLEELIEREEGDETWASQALFFGEFSNNTNPSWRGPNNWIKICCYPQSAPSSDDKNMLHWFRNQAINQWGSPQNASGNGRPSEQHYSIPFEYYEEYTDEMKEADLRTVASHDESIRNVIDLKGIFTTPDAELDRHYIHMATNKAKGRLKATGNYPKVD